MSEKLEQLSKNLAKGMSRRKALGRFLLGIFSGVFATRGVLAGSRGKGNDICVDFCRFQGLEGSDFGACMSASANCPPGHCATAVNHSGHVGLDGAVVGFICVPVSV